MPDRLLNGLLWACGSLTALLLLVIISFTVMETWPFFDSVRTADITNSERWSPTNNQWRFWPMLLGSLLLGLGATIIATPLALLMVIALRYQLPNAIAVIGRRCLELAAGIPTVVFGFWGLVTLVPLIAAWQQPGLSLLAGMVVLALMIIPTIALLADNALANCSDNYQRSAAALGMHPVHAAWLVMVPAAKRGIGIGVVLGLARALGETITVVLVTGNIVQVPDSVFAQVRALTANIALEMEYAVDEHRAALFASGLLLVMLTGLLAAIASRLELRHATAANR